MTPSQEVIESAYYDGVRDGRDAAARESAAEIEGLRTDLQQAEAAIAASEAAFEELRETHAAEMYLRDLAADVAAADLRDVKARLALWNAVAHALRQLLARNQTIQFMPSPGPARLLLGHLGLQGLGMDGLLSALAVVAEECKPCPK